MQHQDCIKVHWGGVPGSQRAEERGLRSTQAGVRYPCASTLGSVRHGSFPWLLRGQLAAWPLLPPSKTTSHTTLFSCYSHPGAEPRGQDTAHVPHSPSENMVLIATTSGLPSTHRGLHRVWTGLQGVVNPSASNAPEVSGGTHKKPGKAGSRAEEGTMQGGGEGKI